MANRPRRSKVGDTTPPKTIDLTAQEASGPDASTPAPAASDTPVPPVTPPDAPASGDDVAATAPPAPTASAAGFATKAAAVTPEPETDSTRKAAPGARRAVTTPLPAPSQQARPAPGEGLADQAAQQEADRTGAAKAGDATAAPAAPKDDATERFAAEEGFTRPLSHADLSEFDDDETVTSAAEPEAVPASDPAPYREPDVQPVPPSAGSLIGAALGGGLVALIGGGILLYSGILPGLPTSQPAATQFASAGEVQRLTGDLTTLRESVEQLQSAQAAGGATTSPVSATDFAALSDRLAAMERSLQNGNTASGDLTSGLDALRGTVDELTQNVQAARDAAAGATQTADAATQAATGARESADQIQQSVTQMEDRLDAIEASNRQAGTALAAAGLKAAIDRGGPFAPELEAYATASGAPEKVDGLRDSAASGVPTLATLQGEWPDVERAMLLALRPDSATAPVGDQLMAGLRSLVTVRPEGAAADTAEGPEGAVGRMSAALRSGDLGAYLSQEETLPDAARQAGADYTARVRARHNADTLLDQALTGAISGNPVTPATAD